MGEKKEKKKENKKEEKSKCDKEEVFAMFDGFLDRFSNTRKHLIGAEKEILLAAKSFLEIGIDLLDHKRSDIDAKKKTSKAKMEKVEIS